MIMHSKLPESEIKIIRKVSKDKFIVEVLNKDFEKNLKKSMKLVKRLKKENRK